MSLSTVMQLNERSTDLASSRLQYRRGDRRVGEHEGEHRRHVRRDHAGALGDAVDDDLRVADLHARGRNLGECVGGHDRARRVHQAVGPGAGGKIAQARAAILPPSSGSPITPVEAMNICAGGAPVASLAASRDMGDRLGADAAGESVGVARIDDQRARQAPCEIGAAPVDRRRGASGAGEHPRRRRRRVEQREHHVGAPGVAHAGRGGRKAHAVDRRQGGIFLRRKRRQRGGSGHGEISLELAKGREESRAPVFAAGFQGVFASAGLSAGLAASPGAAGLASGSVRSIFAVSCSLPISSACAFCTT